MADGMESSECTSAYEHIYGAANIEEPNEYNFSKKPWLGFAGDEQQAKPQGIPYSMINYLELLDWTACIFREDKRGAICAQRRLSLSILGFEDESWLELASSFGKNQQGSVGSLE